MKKKVKQPPPLPLGADCVCLNTPCLFVLATVASKLGYFNKILPHTCLGLTYMLLDCVGLNTPCWFVVAAVASKGLILGWGNGLKPGLPILLAAAAAAPPENMP